MLRKIMIVAAAFSLVSCGVAKQLAGIPASPSAVADSVKLDEQVGIFVTLSYTAAARAASLAIETGLIKDRATIARIGQLNRQAFTAVTAVRNAYNAVNSTGYLSALNEARAAVTALLGALTGPAASVDPTPANMQLFRELADSGRNLLLTDRRLAANHEVQP